MIGVDNIIKIIPQQFRETCNSDICRDTGGKKLVLLVIAVYRHRLV